MHTRLSKIGLQALSGTFAVTRAERFRARMRSPGGFKPVDWQSLVAIPKCFLCTTPQQHRIAIIAAMLYYRPQIDRELSGAQLSALAAMVSEPVFDAVCETEIHGD